MKILSVRLKNITSLRGEHFIAFNQPPFSESGLFAITGPTGAGKSSLLDAITLALYGCAPRFNKDSPLEIMSYYATDCLAEVDFEVHEKVYRSKWSIHRSRGKLDGEIQSPKMELIDVMAGTILESKKTEVINRVSEITGLDYFRFLRSVMLAQGDFAKFLHADKHEKGELLEKITGTDIYTRLSKRAYEKQKEKKQQLEQLECQLDASRLLSEEQKESLQQELMASAAQHQQLEKAMGQYASQLQWLQTLDGLRTKITALKTDLARTYQEKETYQTDFDRYERHLMATPFQPAYKEIELLDYQVKKLDTEIEYIRSAIPTLEKEKGQAQQNAEESQKKVLQAKQEQENSLPVIEQVNGLNRELQLLREHYVKIKNETDAAQVEINRYESGKSAHQTTLTTVNEQYQKVKKYLQESSQDACLETELGLIEQNLTHLYELNKEITTKKKEAEFFNSKKQEYEQKAVSLESDVQKQASELKWIEVQLKQIQAESTKLSNGLSPEEIDSSIQELHKQFIARTNQKETAKHYTDKKETIDFLEKEIRENEQAAADLQKELILLKENEHNAQQQLIILQRLYQTENLILNYEAARQKLQTGEPCPLCGSLEHPFVNHSYEVRLSETEKQRNTQQQLVEDLRQKIDSLNRKVSTFEANHANNSKNLTIYSTQVATLEKEFQQHNQTLGENNLITQLAILQQKLEENTVEQQRLQTLKKELREKSSRIEQYKEKREESQKGKQEMELQLNEVRIQLSNIQEKRQDLQNEISKLSHKKEEQSAVLNNLLLPYGLIIPSENNFRAWVAEISKRSKVYQTYEQQEKELEQSIQKSQTEIEKLQSLIEKTQESFRKLAQEKEELEKQGVALKNKKISLFGDKDPQKEKERLAKEIQLYEQEFRASEKNLQDKNESLTVRKQQLTDKQNQVADFKQSKSDKENHMSIVLQHTGFENISDFRAGLLDSQTELKIKQQKEWLDKKLEGIKGALAQTEKELKEQGAKELTEAGISEINQLLEKTTAEKDELIAQQARVQQTLAENNKLLQKHEHLVSAIQLQRQEYTRWKALSDMIGSATGAEFNVFAQGLTLAKLVQLANHYLNKLNPRYQIRRKPHTDLELEITDRYQADNVRTMKTLSGGETFLVSLSLALGLSDLAGSKTKIDSLFIDEGFGTLDPETLDSAITTLENLQATGKTIGIISHVEALKERITSQIQVSKGAGGVSSIAIIG